MNEVTKAQFYGLKYPEIKAMFPLKVRYPDAEDMVAELVTMGRSPFWRVSFVDWSSCSLTLDRR